MKNLTAAELEMMFNDIWTARSRQESENGTIDEVREEILRKIYEAQKEVK
jgi:hypothetical protein